MYTYNNSCMLIFAMKYYHCTTIGSISKLWGGFSPPSPPIYTLGMSWLMELSSIRILPCSLGWVH